MRKNIWHCAIKHTKNPKYYILKTIELQNKTRFLKIYELNITIEIWCKKKHLLTWWLTFIEDLITIYYYIALPIKSKGPKSSLAYAFNVMTTRVVSFPSRGTILYFWKCYYHILILFFLFNIMLFLVCS